MYIERIPNRNSRPAILLRKSWREGGKSRKKTIANLTDWDDEMIENLSKILNGAVAVFPEEVFSIKRSLPHGHIEALHMLIKKIGLDNLISSRRCREQDLVLAMIVNQIIHSDSKFACVNRWNSTTLGQEFQVEDADENDLYQAMDWLYERKLRIEKKLAKKHLTDGAHALYDISSSYYEGNKCPLAEYGYNRDRKKGKKIIVYGILTNKEGCPVSLEVYPGNTSDSITIPDHVEKLKQQFGLNRVVLVGDRGMLTQTQIDYLKQYEGIGWISALRYEDIRKLMNQQAIQLSLFDHQNIAEIQSSDYPGERLVVCYNPLMNDHRMKKRELLLKATEEELEKIKKQVQRRKKKILDKKTIALKAGKVINKHKMQKHFVLHIEDGLFEYSRNQQSIDIESDIDGFYVVRTTQPKELLMTEDVVRSYKELSKVERLFRTLKGIDIKVRPIRHRLEQRVCAHIFICMLAHYIEWHMRKILAPLLFEDEELEENRKIRDAVAPAQCSELAKRKKSNHKTHDGLPVQSFSSLIDHLATKTWNLCKVKNYKATTNTDKKRYSFNQISEMTPLQQRVFDLINTVSSSM